MSLSVEELASAAGVEIDVVAELEEYGLIAGRLIAGVRCFDEEALAVARVAARFRTYGIESRHLRTFKHAAEREAGLFSQVVTPLLRQRNPAARERATASLTELSELGSAIQDALLRAELRALTGG
jgi:DNA-binding transcriptional MerR regulator